MGEKAFKKYYKIDKKQLLEIYSYDRDIRKKNEDAKKKVLSDSNV